MDIKFKTTNPEEAKKFFENKLAFTKGPAEIDYAIKKNISDYTLIDVRAAEDFQKEHIPGAINLPEKEWASFKGLSKDKLNVLYCYNITCHLAAMAATFFASKGFPVSELDGGFGSWKEHEFTVEKGDSKVA
jgi:rhodanese-related sulfurtransferase